MNRRLLSTSALVLGTTALTLCALLAVVTRSIFRRDAFAERTANALHSPAVREFVAERVTDVIIGGKPDLIAVRPFVLAAANGLVGTRPFEGLVRTAAAKAHQVVFSEGAQRVVIALPDVGVLIRGVLERANPEMAEKIPARLQERIATMGDNRSSELVLQVLRLGSRLRLDAVLLLAAGIALFGLALWASPDRRTMAGRVGVGLSIAGGVLLAITPLVRLVLALVVRDPQTAGAATGLAVSYLMALKGWGLTYLGLGLTAAAGGASVLDRFAPGQLLREGWQRLITPPEKTLVRLGWALLMIGLGLIVVLNPGVVAAGLVAVLGAIFAYAGMRELFRLLERWVASVPAFEAAATRRGWSAPLLATLAVVVAASIVWVLVRKPLATPVVSDLITSCNGSGVLCDRRMDEVVFAGAHNAMSNQSVPGWMFPHHEAGIPRMLRDGIRALAIDVHYGFPGGDRIKTDLTSKSAAKLVEAVGPEGEKVAARIRNTLVGVDEGKRGLYFCHGFCELGAYEVVPVLREVRDFMVANPDEVIILIIEDYVSSDDIVKAFDDAGLTEMVFRGPVLTQWPTLRALITLNQRVIVFLESGTLGVPWLVPTLANIQETPYSFKAPVDFSCVPNRGGTTGALFLLNHWIETTPTPKPSNASIVNAHDSLLARARRCEKERGRLPDILLVDFYRTGDVIGVARELNGVP